MILVRGLLADCIDTGFHLKFWRHFLAYSFPVGLSYDDFLDADTENRLVDTGGQGEGGKN